MSRLWYNESLILNERGIENFMVSIEDVAKLELKIAKIEAVEDHPDADRLYVLRIKVGEEQKTIVAGIKKAYEKEDLVGKKIVVINNLEPATLRGVESQGMLLAASDEDTLTLISPEREIPDGAKVR